MVTIKRIYESPAASDGYRILVDRLWPRGVSRERASLDLWLKDVAPSPDLRTWFGHKPERFTEFSTRYQTELETNTAVEILQQAIQEHDSVTLLYAAHDPACNHAKVLLEYLTAKAQ